MTKPKESKAGPIIENLATKVFRGYFFLWLLAVTVLSLMVAAYGFYFGYQLPRLPGLQMN